MEKCASRITTTPPDQLARRRVTASLSTGRHVRVSKDTPADKRTALNHLTNVSSSKTTKQDAAVKTLPSARMVKCALMSSRTSTATSVLATTRTTSCVSRLRSNTGPVGRTPLPKLAAAGSTAAMAASRPPLYSPCLQSVPDPENSSKFHEKRRSLSGIPVALIFLIVQTQIKGPLCNRPGTSAQTFSR